MKPQILFQGILQNIKWKKTLNTHILEIYTGYIQYIQGVPDKKSYMGISEMVIDTSLPKNNRR